MENAAMRYFEELGISVWVAAPLLLVLWIAVFWGLKLLIYRRLASISKWTHGKLDDILLHALSRPLAFLVIGSGLLMVEHILPLSPALDRLFLLGFRLTLVFAAASFADRLVRRAIDEYADTQPLLKSSRNVAFGLARTLIVALAAFAVLDTLGVSITPLIASLGVGSLAVALALRDTLANLFAGVQLVADRTIEIGQMVRLDSGEEGVVTRVGWRSTHIRMANDVMVIVPNSKLTESRIMNFHRPTPATSLAVDLGVHYSSDLDHVERTVLEVARDVQRTVSGAVHDFDPALNYRGFGDSAIGLTVVLRAVDGGALPKVRHEFMKRIHRRFREEGIVFPYPTRSLQMEEDVRQRLVPPP